MGRLARHDNGMSVGACFQANSARSGVVVNDVTASRFNAAQPALPTPLSPPPPPTFPLCNPVFPAFRRLPLLALNGRAVGSRFSLVAQTRGPDGITSGPWAFSI